MMRSMGRGLACTFVLFCASLSAQLPHGQVVFAYIGLSNAAGTAAVVRDADVQLLDNRLRGYLLEIARQENYSIVSPKNSEQLLQYLNADQMDRFRDELVGFGSNMAANGILYGALKVGRDGGLEFDATLFSSPGGEVVADLSEQAPTIDQLYDRLPAMVYSLFGLQAPNAKSVQLSNQRNSVGALTRERDVQLRDVIGAWQGDYGFTKVEIYGDGTGLAWLSPSESMKIKVAVSGQSISIKQDEPNSPKLYLPVFPYTIAVQVVRLARPMSWDFHISAEKDRLVGIKQTSYFFIENGKILQVDNAYSRDAVWTRAP